VNNRSQDPATVNIWFGSEWPSLRKSVTDALPVTEVPDNAEITIVAESGKPDSAPGRIARWVSTAPALASSAISIFRPGARTLPPPTAVGVVIGITELLLDPDPNQADQLYAVGIWTRIIPRRRKLLMRVTPYLAEEIVANAAASQPVLLIQVAEWRGQHVIVMSRDLIAAEVVGRGIRIIAQPAGDIGINPWETEIVRVASERELGVTSGPGILLVARQAGLAPPAVAAEFRLLTKAVANLVDCTVDFPTGPPALANR
jgi:hypothetical protein